MILTISTMFLTSCNSAQETKDISEIQKMFNIKGNVKEIHTVSKVLTTLGERKFETKTTFNKRGEPIETINYDESGKIESKEPWIKASEDQEKGWELIKEFDTKKRLIKSTKYNNGKIAFENHYRYDSIGNKIEDYETINNEKIEFKYLNNLLSEEITFNKAEDNKFYWYCKKKFNYDDKSNLIEMNVYYYPNDNMMTGKYNYRYDNKGSRIETIVYIGNEISEKTKRKIIYY